MSNAQQRAFDGLLPRYAIPYREAYVDLDAAFGRSAPKILEVGFGMGETTATIAADHPENDYLGIEVHTPGVGSLLRRIEAGGLRNILVIHHDAVEVLENMIAPQRLDGIHIFFPDPWPKVRHHKRRLIRPALVHLLAERLKPGGYLHMATDWAHYADQALAVLTAEPRLVNTVQGFVKRPPYRPLTKFEQRGLGLGHTVYDLIVRRI